MKWARNQRIEMRRESTKVAMMLGANGRDGFDKYFTADTCQGSKDFRTISTLLLCSTAVLEYEELSYRHETSEIYCPYSEQKESDSF